MPSDVAVMGAALFMPFWLCGAACGVVSVLLLVAGFKLFLR
jgi:hypothetical protein